MARMQFHVATIGDVAADALKRNGAGHVVGVYETSITIEAAAGRFVCIGAAGMGNGPLNAICHELVEDGWASQGITDQQAFDVVDGSLQLADGPSFAFSTAATWTAPAWPVDWTPRSLHAGLAALGTLTTRRAPADGLARLVFICETAATGLARQTQRSALLKTATLTDWLAECLTGKTGFDDAACAATVGLMGLGPGLTPAGDDVLSGLLIALHATGHTAIAHTLADFVRSAPLDATSPLSRAFLEAAIAGKPSDAMATAVDALMQGPVTRLPAAIARLDDIGHTSGWDMLAGAVLALATVAGAQSHAFDWSAIMIENA